MSFYVRIYNGEQRAASGLKRPYSASSSTDEPPTKLFRQSPSHPGASYVATSLYRNLGKVKRLEHLQKFYDMHVQVDEDDKKKCRNLTWETIKNILTDVRMQDGEKSVYSVQPEKAGSYSIDAKVGKADEFDWIVPVKAVVDVNKDYTRTEMYFSFNHMVIFYHHHCVRNEIPIFAQ